MPTDSGFLILCINPGSTSTKVGLFRNETAIRETKIEHSPSEVKRFKRVAHQLEFRANLIDGFLADAGYEASSLSAVVGRGGMMKPIPGGTYAVNDVMLADLADYCVRYYGSEHISNLGAALARRVAAKGDAVPLIVDPISTDDFIPVSRISGVPEFERVSLMHSLNLRAKGRYAARQVGVAFDDANLVGCHLGGGISMAAFCKGRAIDSNHGLLGYGPFSPQRAGTLAISAVIELCLSGKYTQRDLMRKFGKNSGLIAYLGTDDGREVAKRIEAGDRFAKLIFEAMAVQIAKEIGALATVLHGDLSCIFITGGLANQPLLTAWIEERVKYIAPVLVLPGEDELQAMLEGALRVLRGEEQPLAYTADDSLRERIENPDKFRILNQFKQER